MKLYLSLLFIFLMGSFANAQPFSTNGLPPDGYCVSDQLHKQKLKTDKSYSLKTQSTNEAAHLIQTQGIGHRTSAGMYTIPVVVHIIHNNGPENITDQQVIDGIKHLNDAFKHLIPFNGAGGADIGIEFCLSKQDPSGNPTTGINRVQSSLTNLEYTTYDQQLKNLSRWDTKKYLNIWLVKEICSGSNCGVAGYAYLAGAHGTSFDGVVNEARWFGSSADNSKVHIHEVGHYLNLYHTFEGGCTNNNCLLDGDQVCDTPPDNSTAAVFPCNSIANSCTTDQNDLSAQNPFRPIANGGLGEQNDMIQNYMDYGYQTCQNLFTEGQKTRMVAALLGIRSSLLDSKGCTPPCTNPLTAAFAASTLTANAGSNISFTNQSVNATSYKWKLNGTVFSTALHSSYTFNTPGTFTIWLVASNGDAFCTDSTSKTFTINCPASSSFTASTHIPSTGQNVTFTNTSTGANQYQWSINGSGFSTTTNSNYTFNTVGQYILTLQSTNSTYNCFTSTNDTFNVVCAAHASFTPSKTNATVGETLSFTNTSTSATTYRWLINGVFYASTTNITYAFPATSTGNNAVTLVASNGSCTDTLHTTIRIQSPCANSSSKHANFWYFGNYAGINFNSGSAVAVTDGQLSTREGVATISNSSGQLLFYTDGSNIWNKNHAIMASGLRGNISSTQSAVIVQNPGNSSKYYVFTADIVNGSYGYNYSEVDMTMNTGFGGVVAATKNTNIFYNHTEKITATYHANGVDVWILMHEGNNSNFRAYLLTSAGLSTTPVISSVGSVTNVSGDWNAIGYMKFSRDGSKLVNAFDGSQYKAELFAFNKSTGVLTGPNVVFSPLSAAYGVEFSNNGTYLYISELQRDQIYGAGYNYKGAIAQYNLTAGTSAAINSSRVVLISSPTISYGALQMAPDGKIYAAKENGFSIGASYLGVINNPNALGTASNYVENGFYLAGRTTLIGLPNFISSDYTAAAPITLGGKPEVCSGGTELYTLNNTVKSAITWTVTGNGSTLASTDSTITIKFGTTGSVKIKATAVDCAQTYADSLTVNIFSPTALNLGKDTSFCTTAFPRLLSAGPGFSSYVWKGGSTNSTYSATTAGTYWLAATNSHGCVSKDTITLLDLGLPVVANLSDVEVCEGTNALLDAGSGTGYTYYWQDGSTNQTYNAFLAGKYWVRVSNTCNTLSDTAYVTVKPLPLVTFATDQNLCLDNGPVTLVGTPAGGTFAGSGISNNTFSTAVAGLGDHVITYTYTSPNSCSASNQQIISVKAGGSTLLKDTVVCQTVTLILNPGTFTSYAWQDGSTQATYTVTTAGTYSVRVTESSGCVAYDTITVSNFADVTIGRDTTICARQLPLVLHASPSFASYLWKDGSTNNALTITTAGTYWIEVSNTNGCYNYDTIEVALVPAFDIDLADQIICPGTAANIDAGVGFDSYTWQDGSHNQLFYTTNPGLYAVTVTRSCESAQDTVTLSNYAVVPPTIFGLAPSYCVSHDNVTLTATPSGGVFSGSGMVGSVLHIKTLSLGRSLVIYSYVDANGCTNRDTAFTMINEECFFIPNLITPNNDGQNDAFEVIGIGNNYTLEIYNRWGDLIYRKENYDNSFTGEGLSDGVYFFELTHPQKDKTYKGWLQIVDKR